MIMFVCPKCNKYLMSIHGLTEKCECCGTQMIETKYDEEKVDMTRKELKEVIFNEYVKDNPLYDPEEAKRTEEYLIKRRNSPASYKQVQPANVPKCPTCGSTNVEKIGTLERGISVAVFGLFSGKLGKTMECRNCGYKW